MDELFDTWELALNVDDPYLDPAFARFGIKFHNLLQVSSFDEAHMPLNAFAKRLVRDYRITQSINQSINQDNEETMG